METKIISYNLKDRGRKFRGKDRHFNIAQIVKAINSNETQERVKKRDMLGYYGHWPRVKFGMLPSEGGMTQGNLTVPEPAIVTTFLKAYPDGTVEHKAEFLNTDAGKLASKLYSDRVGGFSSAIDQSKPEFFGFDYVLEPNYSTNRGWDLLDSVLDSVGGSTVTMDQVDAAIYGEQIRGVMLLLDKVNAEREIANRTIEHLRDENEELYQMLERKDKEAAKAAKLDSVSPAAYRGVDPRERMKQDAKLFLGAKSLPSVVMDDASSEESKKRSDEAFEKGIYRHFLANLV